MSVTLAPPLPAEERHAEDRHWTVEEFYQAADAGAFDDPARLEIIHGRLKRLMQGNRHANLRVRLSRRLRRWLEPQIFVRDENPLHIAFDGEPVADLLVTYGEEYEGRHPEPADVALLVEVADTSVEYDLGDKALLYSQSGIADYWVVLAKEMAVVRHREPTPEGYGDVVRLAGQDVIFPLAAPDAVWTVDALLGREERTEEN